MNVCLYFSSDHKNVCSTYTTNIVTVSKKMLHVCRKIALTSDTHVILKWDETPIQLLYHQTSYGIITIWTLSNLAALATHLYCL